MKLTPMTCTNCGGTINRATMICEYCGTKFQDDGYVIKPLIIEHQTSPVRILKMQTSISHELMRDECMAKDVVSNIAMNNIRDQLAKALEDMMTIEMTYDVRQMRHIITARVRVLEPDYRF